MSMRIEHDGLFRILVVSGVQGVLSFCAWARALVCGCEYTSVRDAGNIGGFSPLHSDDCRVDDMYFGRVAVLCPREVAKGESFKA